MADKQIKIESWAKKKDVKHWTKQDWDIFGKIQRRKVWGGFEKNEKIQLHRVTESVCKYKR